eukprot:IDg5986t1
MTTYDENMNGMILFFAVANNGTKGPESNAMTVRLDSLCIQGASVLGISFTKNSKGDPGALQTSRGETSMGNGALADMGKSSAAHVRSGRENNELAVLFVPRMKHWCAYKYLDMGVRRISSDTWHMALRSEVCSSHVAHISQTRRIDRHVARNYVRIWPHLAACTQIAEYRYNVPSPHQHPCRRATYCVCPSPPACSIVCVLCLSPL